MNNRVIRFRYFFSNGTDWKSQEYTLDQIINGEPFEFLSDSPFPGSKEYKMMGHVQFTGLHDKEGKEIYEGDIVSVRDDKNMVISWSERFASFVINREGWAFQHWFGEAMDGNDCKVIGNIYQHPDLLKTGEQNPVRNTL
jgi:hypothetical protein